MVHNKDFETDSPIVTVLASAAPARTRANDGSQLMRSLYRPRFLHHPPNKKGNGESFGKVHK
jgi:hypothetical protein